ncbi:MAG: MAPEG family protein [Pseudomarimonas sp.]
MTTAYWCVLAAGVMPYLWVLVSKVTGARYDNRDPRAWQARLSGMPARAHSAHLNSFEAFPLFAAAVIIAQLSAADQSRTDMFAMAFIVLRLLYGICYIADWEKPRSLVWLAAFGCCIGLFFGSQSP